MTLSRIQLPSKTEQAKIIVNFERIKLTNDISLRLKTISNLVDYVIVNIETKIPHILPCHDPEVDIHVGGWTVNEQSLHV